MLENRSDDIPDVTVGQAFAERGRQLAGRLLDARATIESLDGFRESAPDQSFAIVHGLLL